jgi:hypothetical protein
MKPNKQKELINYICLNYVENVYINIETTFEAIFNICYKKWIAKELTSNRTAQILTPAEIAEVKEACLEQIKTQKRHIEIIRELAEKINNMIVMFPYSSCKVSLLGGESQAAIMICIGLDSKRTWTNGIFENSRYVRFSIDKSMLGLTLEPFTCHLKNKDIKFRKYNGSTEQVMETFIKYCETLKAIA